MRTGTGRGRRLAWAAAAVVLFAAADAAAGDPWNPPTARAQELAREFADPLTSVPQFSLQDIYTPQSFGTAAQANTVVGRLIVPRLPPFAPQVSARFGVTVAFPELTVW